MSTSAGTAGQRFNGGFAHHARVHGGAAGATRCTVLMLRQPLVRQLRDAQVGQTVLHAGADRRRDARRAAQLISLSMKWG